MKRLIYIIAIIFATGLSSTVHAVTDKEMDQARALAAQAYLRYANDGSGYLDEVRPKSMADLEKRLKPKEKENLKAFKAIGVPKGYESWGKDKLVEYWAGTAFASKGLLEKGRIGKSRARKRINAMTLSAPDKAPAPKEAAPAQAAPAPSAAAPADKPAISGNNAPVTAAPSDSARLAEAEAQLQAASDLGLEEEEPLEKAENHTWVYIVILIVLVGVVVALVVFASNIMKKNGGNISGATASPAPRPAAQQAPVISSAGAEANALREKFAARLTEKNNELHSLNKKMEEINAANASLKQKVEALSSEVVSLRSRLSESSAKISQLQAEADSLKKASAVQSPAAVSQAPAPRQEAPIRPQAEKPVQQAPQQSSSVRTIFLGRANAKGIFIRADRTLNLGNSIYRLDTTDGYSGTFRVAADPTVWEMALLTPRESLSYACVAADIDNTDGMEKIVNDAAGTAVFENGCWKVIRKAKIHYE